jgi:RNA polymerase sigma-70 factor (ECF subfamily)
LLLETHLPDFSLIIRGIAAPTEGNAPGGGIEPHMNDSQNNKADLQRACEGDDRALGRILLSLTNYLQPLAAQFCNGKCHSLLDESDLIQITFYQASKSIRSFRGSTMSEFTSWLRVIAVRTMKREVEKHRAREVPVQPKDGLHDPIEDVTANSSSSPERKAIRNELEARVMSQLAHLSPEMQQVILYRVVDNLPHKEIAKKLNKTEVAIRILFFRALERFGKLWKAQENGSDPDGK